MKPFRVFVTRHYIAVECLEVEAANERQARSLAERAVKAMIPDARAIATDNGWISDEPCELPHLGYSSADFSDNLVLKYEDKRTGGKVFQEGK